MQSKKIKEYCKNCNKAITEVLDFIIIAGSSSEKSKVFCEECFFREKREGKREGLWTSANPMTTELNQQMMQRDWNPQQEIIDGEIGDISYYPLLKVLVGDPFDGGEDNFSDTVGSSITTNDTKTRPSSNDSIESQMQSVQDEIDLIDRQIQALEENWDDANKKRKTSINSAKDPDDIF